MFHSTLGAGCLREDMFFAAMEEAWLKLKTENDAIHSPSSPRDGSQRDTDLRNTFARDP